MCNLRLYHETLKLISAGRAKLDKQNNEYEILAQDLQTRYIYNTYILFTHQQLIKLAMIIFFLQIKIIIMARLDDKEIKASEISGSFKEFKREIMSKAENSRTGLPISNRMITQFETLDDKKNEELEKVRLRHIGLKQSLKKLENTLKAKEQLAEGLHMIDFEQLKIENQTLNEKIEERNEEFSKLKKKKLLTIQVLTHVREKLRFVKKKNIVVKSTIDDLDAQINAQRGLISTAKKDRDSVKDVNVELKRQQGFAGSELLLTDYESRKSDIESMRIAIKELQERKFLLNQQIRANNNKTKETLLLRGSMEKSTLFPPIGKK